ncbi:MAG TPA: RidA family protein [Candidatus Latescibacteria bacterium]|nr:RidA family protein [Candidatus Latescibacterota bacterium]
MDKFEATYQKKVVPILKKRGSLKDIVKLNAYVTRREHYEVFRKLRREYFGAPFPAATGMVVAGLLDLDWLVEI